MKHTRAAMLAVLVFTTACDRFGPPDPQIDPSPTIDAELRAIFDVYGVVPIGPLAQQDPALVALGRALMFDKVLSGNRDISCATCHEPGMAFTDGRSLAVGTGATGTGMARLPGTGRGFVPRSSPTLLNQGLRANAVFWDGRISGSGAGPFETPLGGSLPGGLSSILVAQAMFPVLNRDEMRGLAGDVDVNGNTNELANLPDDQPYAVWGAVMQRLMAIPGYVSMFQAAFPQTGPGGYTFQQAATAIAAFQTQSLTFIDSPFDRYLNRDNNALPLQAKRGAQLFFGKAACNLCHNGPLLGGNGFASTGVPQLGPGIPASAPLDIGRAAVVGGINNGPPPEFYRFAFRIPPLRNVELTAPYFHNGAYATLEAVVDHYNDIPTALATYNPNQLESALRNAVHNDNATRVELQQRLDFRLQRQLELTTTEMADLVAFLRSMTDPAARNLDALTPASVPSGLPVR